MSESEEISDTLMEFVEAQAQAYGLEVEQTINALERQYGIDLADVTEDDAEDFVRAVEQGDGSTIEDLLIEYGASDEAASEFREMVESTPDDPEPAQGDGEPRGNGESPSAEPAGGGGGMGEQQVRQIVRDEVGQAVRDAVGGQQQAQPTQPAQPQQNQMVVAELAKHFLSDTGGGEAAALGQEVQKEAMRSFIKDLRKPDFGDLLEMKYYEEALGSDVVENMMGEWLPEDADDEDANSVMGMFPMGGDDDSEDD